MAYPFHRSHLPGHVYWLNSDPRWSIIRANPCHLVSHNGYGYVKSSLKRPKSNLSKKKLSLRSSTIVDVRALLRVDYSQLVIMVQLYQKDATMSVRHWMLWARGWIRLNISNTVRDSIRNPIYANDGSDLTKEWINISDIMRYMN